MQEQCTSLLELSTQALPEEPDFDSQFYDIYDVIMNKRIPGNAIDAFLVFLCRDFPNIRTLSFALFQYRGVGFHNTNSSSELTEAVKRSVKKSTLLLDL